MSATALEICLFTMHEQCQGKLSVSLTMPAMHESGSGHSTET